MGMSKKIESVLWTTIAVAFSAVGAIFFGCLAFSEGGGLSPVFLPLVGICITLAGMAVVRRSSAVDTTRADVLVMLGLLVTGLSGLLLAHLNTVPDLPASVMVGATVTSVLLLALCTVLAASSFGSVVIVHGERPVPSITGAPTSNSAEVVSSTVGDGDGSVLGEGAAPNDSGKISFAAVGRDLPAMYRIEVTMKPAAERNDADATPAVRRDSRRFAFATAVGVAVGVASANLVALACGYSKR